MKYKEFAKIIFFEENKMKDNRFITGVSDWEITFENGEKVILDALMQETIKIHADTRKKIKINNATFNSKLVDLFKNGININNLKQTFDVVNSENNVVDEVEYNYKDLYIDNVVFISATDSVTEVNVVFKSK